MNNVYSLHEPLEEFIRTGKAHKRYEFGRKIGVASASRGAWFVRALAFHGYPYDRHILKDALLQIERFLENLAHAFVDWEYRCHGYEVSR